MPACNAREIGSLKSITNPYIANYECTEAYFGKEDFLGKFDYIELNLINKKEFEFIYKLKGEKKRVIKSEYSVNPKTNELPCLSAEIGILGQTFHQTVKIENGKFTISKTICGKQLILKFKAK